MAKKKTVIDANKLKKAVAEETKKVQMRGNTQITKEPSTQQDVDLLLAQQKREKESAIVSAVLSMKSMEWFMAELDCIQHTIDTFNPGDMYIRNADGVMVNKKFFEKEFNYKLVSFKKALIELQHHVKDNKINKEDFDRIAKMMDNTNGIDFFKE